jgi:tetraacyldisaccharide 4'-kinase
MREVLSRAWMSCGPLALVLWPVAACFGILVWFRQLLYRWRLLTPQTLPVPVVIVGNVLVGGVGKTPVVIALVQHLQQRGIAVGVLSRGYARQSQDLREVRINSSAKDVGDEPLLIYRSTGAPVWVGAHRASAGRALLQEHPNVQVVVCDDGLQHLPLSRDIELCVFDERGIGNGWVLPAGPLREPWPRRSTPSIHCFDLSSANEMQQGRYRIIRQLADFAVRADGTRRSLKEWQHHPVQALAGIAKPQVFFDMLREQGVMLNHTQALPDHHDFDVFIINPSLGEVLCTEKDAVKLWRQNPEVWAVPLVITLPLEMLQAFDQLLDTKLSSDHGLQTT